MSGVNKVILIGNLGKDPELRNFEGGNMSAKFTLATNEVYRDKNGNRAESTEWHNITMWGKLADIAGKLLRKGSLIYVEGKLRTRSWEDKDGHKKYMTEVAAENFTLLDRKSTNGGLNEGEAGTADLNSSMPPEINSSHVEDDLPF